MNVSKGVFGLVAHWRPMRRDRDVLRWRGGCRLVRVSGKRDSALVLIVGKRDFALALQLTYWSERVGRESLVCVRVVWCGGVVLIYC